jgi:hypothetical protein
MNVCGALNDPVYRVGVPHENRGKYQVRSNNDEV